MSTATVAPAGINTVVTEVVRRFGDRTVLDGLDLTIASEELVVLLGPSGCGKSTLLRLLAGLDRPDAGTVEVPKRRAVVFQADRLLPWQRVLANVTLGLRGADADERGRAALFEVGLGERTRAWPKQLSGGEAQRVALARALVAEPELVLLDEPFSGLDPVNENLFREVILELKRQGTTIIFSTHNMAVAEQLCDFIFMIYRGRKVLDGTLDLIQDSYGFDTLRVRVEGASLNGLPGVDRVTDFGRYQELRLVRGADPQGVLVELMRRGRVDRFERTRPSLHDIFVRIANPPTDGPADGLNPSS